MVHYQVTINYGDTLENIAHRYISDEYKNAEAYINEVRNINHLDNKKQIIAGESLIVPYFSSTHIP